MFQSLLSPIRSRFDSSSRSQDPNDPTSPANANLTSPRGGASILSPRSPLAWGVTSPALSVFGTQASGNTTGFNSTFTGNDADDMANAEEFARDVLVELMRGAVEDMRVRAAGSGTGISQEDVKAQVKVLSEIHRIMEQDVATLNSSPSSANLPIDSEEPRTKAVFREMDGFLCLMSVLSALSAGPEAKPSPEPQQLSEAGEAVVADEDSGDPIESCLRWVFVVLSEALEGYTVNEVYFRTNVGWDVLAEALRALLSGSLQNLRPQVLSLLLALSLCDFEPPFDSYFDVEPERGLDSVDAKISEVKAPREKEKEKTQTRMEIKHSGAMRVLWTFIEEEDDGKTRYALYKIVELLYGVCHRNGGILSSLGFVGDVFRRFQDVRALLKNSAEVEDAEGGKERDLEKQKQILHRLLRKLLEMGSNTTEARRIFQVAVIKGDEEKLDPEILEVIRFGMKSRWVEHFSFEGRAAIVLSDEQRWRTLPKDGLSFMMWFFPSSMPQGRSSHSLFSADSTVNSSPTPTGRTRTHLKLSLLADGRLRIYSSAAPDQEAVFAATPNSKLKRGRWTHLTLVWYPKKGGHPNLRLYLDGVFVEGLHIAYPRPDTLSGTIPGVQYTVGDLSSAPVQGEAHGISWCLASAYLLGIPLPDDIPRLIHHLGPRYTGSFQDPALVRFLTYEAATSLNMFLANATNPHLSMSPMRSPTSGFGSAPSLASVAARAKQGPTGAPTPILKALREGMPSVGVREETVLFGFGPSGFGWGVDSREVSIHETNSLASPRRRSVSGSWSERDQLRVQKTVLLGDVFVVKAESLDVALWKIGGAAVALRLVDHADTPHELSRTLGILTDGLKNSWQNSEDMERMRGYDILAAILRRKAHLINLTAFETLFEFLGLNFNAPEQSTVVNPLAYKAIALDFSIWAKTGAATVTPNSAAPVSASSALSSKPKIKLTGYKKQIQRVHLEHFSTLLITSRYRAFNWRVGLGEGTSSSKNDKGGKGAGRSLGLVRRILFALQMGWYSGGGEEDDEDMTHDLVEALGVALRSPGGFSKEDVKAVVAFLAANLHDAEGAGGDAPANANGEAVKSMDGNHLQIPDDEHGDGATTPQSAVSHFSFTFSFGSSAVSSQRENAEKVFELLVKLLQSQPAAPGHSPSPQVSYYQKFTASLPLTRILLLLLGDHPKPHTAALVLRLINLGISKAPNFIRKFELVSGWNMLKVVLPNPKVWNAEVNRAALDVLLGRNDSVPESAVTTPTSANVRKEKQRQKQKSTEVSCPQILPTIISALRTGLVAVAEHCRISDEEGEATPMDSWGTERAMEHLVEELLTLHATSATFRQAFESQQTTQLFINAYKAMIEKLNKILINTPEGETSSYINGWNVRILEKLSHFGLALALDNAVGGSQKREILNNIQSAEVILDPGATTTSIDPGLMVDNRSVRQRFASARFSMQVGERTVIKTMTRMAEWRKTVRASENKRFRKMVLDLREFRRQVSRLTEWTNLLTSERGLWPHHDEILWRLDETEGPHRIRKKLEPQIDNSPSSRIDGLDELIRDVRPPPSETASVIQTEVPPWAETYEISATEVDDQQQLAEDIVDDKLRRVRHELEPGDVIEAVATVAKIDGVDSSPGLLILGRTHIYMLDGVVENEEGEVIDAHEAPKRLFFVPGSIVELNGPQKAQRWTHRQIATCSDKKFLFRDVALEIYFRDSRSLLIVFLDVKKRSEFEARLSAIMGRPSNEYAITPGPASVRTPVFGSLGSRMLGIKTDELSTATRRWQAREISNFAYLSILNQISGRTPSDATQYPVFPWVLSDYTSQILDLNNPESYRDLTKPMGALTPARRQAAETRYSNLQSVAEEPFHYGTHFSSSMIVCHFLIRLAPFTNMFKTLQGGDWDLPDRLFSDLPRAFESAAHDVRGDVRELIPEFFTCPEFLENTANHDFGVLQQTGEKIHDVKLPPWARQDPLLFIVLNRRALESPIVSEQLPAWIDLIWGCKQRDPASTNVFHPLSYEGSIDLDSIKDDLEREATVGIIHNFGQTPRKLFTAPHPERYNHGLHTLPIGILHGIEEDPHLLTQSQRCFKDLGPTNPVRNLIPDYTSEKMIPCSDGVLCLPQYPHEHIEWRSPGASSSSTSPKSSSSISTGELRVVIDNKVAQVVENACVSCAVFADAACLVTGSTDYTVRLWKVNRTGSSSGPSSAGPSKPHNGSLSAGHTAERASGGASGMRIALSHIMRVHTDEVVSVAASRPWSLVVSGSRDGSAAVWDLNRGCYVRSIWHGVEGAEGREETGVELVAINESTGYIATCSRLKLCLHTINARPIATLDLSTTSSFSSIVPSITAMAFHEREYSHLGVLATGGPDGTITLRTWTADGTEEGERAGWEFLTIRSVKVRIPQAGVGVRVGAVTALRFLGENLYHGEETGKSYVWNLPDS